MANGVSIHIGLNKVDPAGYNGWSGVLAGCESDALAMQKIAKAYGYSSQKMLLTADATSQAVCEAIGQAAQDLVSGDYLLLTYSGHGGQVPDTNGDEDDGQDETWVLYDRMLVDDELYSIWSQFAAGVRIFVLSDSCHSGTVVRMLIQSRSRGPVTSPKQDYYTALADMAKGTKATGFPQPNSRYKNVPGDVQANTWKDHEALYRTVQWVAGRPKDRDVNASIVLISGCQDNQLSMDGDQNGLFTEKLLKTWNDGAFEGGHYAFYEAIKNLMPPSQTPNYYTTGATDSTFEDAKPFVIEASSGATGTSSTSTDAGAQDAGTQNAGATTSPAPGKPSVTGPDSASQDQPPSFTVDLAGNPYYSFEIADSQSLLDSPPASNDAHYYGTWADTNERARLTDTTYRIMDEAWAALSGASTLYYRVCTTSSSSPTEWLNYRTSDVQTLSVTPTKALRSAPPPSLTKPVARRGTGRRDTM